MKYVIKLSDDRAAAVDYNDGWARAQLVVDGRTYEIDTIELVVKDDK
jgi:hypothetical protein